MAESRELPSLETDELSLQHPLPSPSLISLPPTRESLFNSTYEIAPSPGHQLSAHPVTVSSNSHLLGRPLEPRNRYPEVREELSEPVQHDASMTTGYHPQTGHLRSLSDSSSEGHTPDEEASPQGSPKEKFEELVMGGETFNKDKRRFRDRPRPTTGRLGTFWNWTSPYPAERLAAAGFIYEGLGDQVKCTKCRSTLLDWELSDDPYVEHRNAYGYDCFKP